MNVRTATIAAIRYGYGFHPDQPGPRDASDLLHAVRRGQRADLVLPVAGSADRRDRVTSLIEIRKSGDREAQRAFIRTMRKDTVREVGRRIYQRAMSPHGLFERLAAFWANHFSVTGRNPGQLFMVPVFEIEAIRPHVGGAFSDMLKAVVQHPVMLHYLDQTISVGPGSKAGRRRGRGLNENLAREILELHTLGVDGPYSQKDVRELAELLTGFGAQKGYLNFRFFPNRAEPGAETVLGRRYGGDPPRAEHALRALDDIARHPATARHLARKLAAHFMSDTPPAGLVRHIAAAFERSGGDLMATYEAMLEHPAAWSDFGAKVKRPDELLISTLRAVGADRQMAGRMEERFGKQIFGALKMMGQPMFQAPGPDGWSDEAAAWITPQGLAARLRYASRVGQLLAKSRQLDPRAFAEIALRDALRADTRFAVGAAPDRWEGFAFTLASPEFNRR